MQRRTTYYNKRPAEERIGAKGGGRSAELMRVGRLEGRKLSNWVKGSTDGNRRREMGWNVSGYLQRLKVWRLEAGWLARLQVSV